MSINLALATLARLQNPQKICGICFEDSFEDDPENWFIYECSFCQVGVFCAKCLKQWFLDACKNEYKMPPCCCRIVPISAVSYVLQPSEVSNSCRCTRLFQVLTSYRSSSTRPNSRNGILRIGFIVLYRPVQRLWHPDYSGPN
jgi:hypothetical protein